MEGRVGVGQVEQEPLFSFYRDKSGALYPNVYVEAWKETVVKIRACRDCGCYLLLFFLMSGFRNIVTERIDEYHENKVWFTRIRFVVNMY